MMILAFTLTLLAAVATAWPPAMFFPASNNLPGTWDDVKRQADQGILRTANSMVLASADDDSFIPFSIKPSRIEGIPSIYAVAYSLDSGELISAVGRIKTSEYIPFGIASGGIVSMRIPLDLVSDLAATSGVPAVRLAIIAPEVNSPETVGQWASDSVVFVLNSNTTTADPAPVSSTITHESIIEPTDIVTNIMI